MKNKLFGTLYLGSLTYAIYCMVDRACKKTEEKGYNEGFNAGRDIGKLEAYIDMYNKYEAHQRENEKSQDEDEESE